MAQGLGELVELGSECKAASSKAFALGEKGGLGGPQDTVPSLKNRGEGLTLTGPLPHFRTWKKTRLPACSALLKTKSGGLCPFLSICFVF